MTESRLTDEREGNQFRWLNTVAAVAVAGFTLSAQAEVATPAGPAPAPLANLLPLDHFIRHDELGTIKISPDGSSIAMSTTTQQGRSALVFVSLADRKLVGGAQVPDQYLIADFDWVSPSRIVYSIAERGPDVTQPGLTGELLAIDSDGRRQRPLYGFRAGQGRIGTRVQMRESTYASAELVSALRRDEDNVLIAETPWRVIDGYFRYDRDAKPLVSRLNVLSGKKVQIDTAPLRGATLVVDRNDDVRFAFGYNEHFRVAASWKPRPGDPWQEFELPGFRDGTIIPYHFSADNRAVIFTGVREGESLRKLYQVDLQTQAVQLLHGFEDVDVAGVITDLAGSEVIGVRADRARAEHHWLDKDHPATQLYLLLERAFPGQSIELTSASDDGRLAVVFVSSDTNPGEYFLFDATRKKADFIRASRQWIDPRQMRPKEHIEVASRDGLVLYGYLTRPEGEQPHALVVLPHGGPHGIRDTWRFDDEVQLLANRGYAVLQLNFRGSDGYGVDFEAAGFRQWGARMQDDLTDATRWAIQRGIADPARICIYGASYGGYAALMGVAREPQLYRCAIGSAGVYDLELMRSSADIPDSRLGLSYLDEVLGNDRVELYGRSPVNLAKRIEVPVLLIHGRSDWRADPQQFERMKAALEQAGKPVESLLLDREGHGYYDPQARQQVYQRILDFLDRHL